MLSLGALATFHLLGLVPHLSLLGGGGVAILVLALMVLKLLALPVGWRTASRSLGIQLTAVG